jgi:aspartate/methionine/tyrosine aminotransferase
MPKFSSLVDRIAGEGSAAWDIHFKAKKADSEGKDVIVMSVGDPDFATPSSIVEVAVNALRSGDTHYSEITGRPKLRKAVAAETIRVSGDTSYKVKPENVMVMAGTQNALFGASLCVLEKGDEVIVLDPMYVTYEAAMRIMDATLVRVATPRANGFRPDINAIKEAITPNTKAIAFATPNNPTGVVMTKAELQAIADLAIKNDLWVIADEVYAAQTFEQPHFSIAAIPGMAERTITCSSLSKSQAMTGWRIGWMVGPEELIRHADNLGLAMLYGIPPFIQEAAYEALTGSRHEVEHMLEIYRKRRDLVSGLLKNATNAKVLVPEAGMFVLLDVSATGMSANEFARRLYDSEGVSALDGAAFGEPAASCVRLSFTSSEKQLEEGCRRILRFLSSLNG